MARRWGLGPVFAREMMAGARRWQVYAVRAMVVLALLAWLGMIWSSSGGRVFVSANDLAAVGRQFFVGLMVIQLAMVLIAAPAAAAGALCVDKARGTLLHVLVTDLTDWEIVAGKLTARLAPVLALLACGLPVMAICSLFGGIAPEAVVGAYLVTAGTAILACTVALTLSVWARKTHQALLGTYAILTMWSGGDFAVAIVLNKWFGGATPENSPLTAIALYTNPFGMALIPVSGGPPSWPIGLAHQAIFFLFTILASLFLLHKARRGLRPATLSQANRPARREAPGAPARLLRLLPEPPLDGNPVLWREWHRKRPSRWAGRAWGLYAGASAVASLLAITFCYLELSRGDSQWFASQVNGWGLAIGLLLLSVSAATALGEERDRGSLDIIMATPLPTSMIYRGKWWGTFAMVPRLLILPTWIAVGLAMVSGHGIAAILLVGLILAYASAIVSLGLALATWIPRLGRVVTAIVIAYALVSAGWPILIATLAPAPYLYGIPDSYLGRGLSMASPYAGASMLTKAACHIYCISGETPNYGYGSISGDAEVWEVYAWAVGWIVAYGALAATLALATRLSFDRCMGRAAVSPWLRSPPAVKNKAGAVVPAIGESWS